MDSAVKFLSLLAVTSLAAHAAADNPGKAALDFLEKVRLRNINLQPGGDTALSPATGEEKRKEIGRRLDRMARDLGTDPLELGEVKQDDDFAAVLVRKTNSFDPSRLRVFPVAVVKRAGSWSPAPLPASFENAGAGYAIALRKRLETLETWMLREQVIDLEQLREQSASKLRGEIEAHLPIRDLKSFTANEAVERFLAACEGRDLPAVLGFLGGLSAKLPDDWPLRLRAASDALGKFTTTTGAWRLLTAPEVLRVSAKKSATHNAAAVEVICLDPTGGTPRYDQVEFDVTRGGDGLWQVHLASNFLLPSSSDSKSASASRLTALSFTTKYAAAHPPAAVATAELARDAWLAAQNAPTLAPLMKLAAFPADQTAALRSCNAAVQRWWQSRDPAAVRYALPVAFRADADAACALMQIFAARTPDVAESVPVYFQKSSAGWLWSPVASEAATNGFRDWISAETARASKDWQEILLRPSPVVTAWDASQPPTRQDAETCVKTWLDACRKNDLTAALSVTARLADENGSAALLRNLGFEVVGFRRAPDEFTVTGIYQGKRWTAVGVKIGPPNGPARYPFYAVLQTPSGPRIVAELSIFASRDRDFLNRTAFDRLAQAATPEASAELRTLFAEHEENIDRLRAKP